MSGHIIQHKTTDKASSKKKKGEKQSVRSSSPSEIRPKNKANLAFTHLKVKIFVECRLIVSPLERGRGWIIPARRVEPLSGGVNASRKDHGTRGLIY